MSNLQLAPRNLRLETSFHCPTCGAKQSPAMVCRRCRCDLSLLAAMSTQENALHDETLRLLRIGRHDEASQSAQQRWRLQPDTDAARLLAVCYLLQGHFQAALDVRDAACQPITQD